MTTGGWAWASGPRAGSLTTREQLGYLVAAVASRPQHPRQQSGLPRTG